MSDGIGVSPARVGGLERVTGAQAYVADIHLDGELYVKLVTVDHARVPDRRHRRQRGPGRAGRPSRADRGGPAPAHAAVRARSSRTDRCWRSGETHYHGEPVAAVAAETLDAAEAAAALVRVEGEPLPAVVTIAAALAPDAPLVQDPSLRPDDRLAGTNVLREHRYGWGDVEAAAADAEVVVEGTYRLPDGHAVRDRAARVHGRARRRRHRGLELDPASVLAPARHGRASWGCRSTKVRIYAPDPGGGFGGKQHAKYEPLVAFLALRTGRPVPPRADARGDVPGGPPRRVRGPRAHRVPARRPIVFRDIEANYLIGAYADIADRTVAKGSYTVERAVRVPAVRIVARSVLSHTVPSTAFRGFGNPAADLGGRIEHGRGGARSSASTRVELRLRNLPRAGDAFIPGDTPADGDWAHGRCAARPR